MEIQRRGGARTDSLITIRGVHASFQGNLVRRPLRSQAVFGQSGSSQSWGMAGGRVMRMVLTS